MLDRVLNAPPILDKIFVDFFTFQYNFSSLQVKCRNVGVASRFAEQLKTSEITRQSPKCLNVMTSTQPTTQEPNFDVFGKISQKKKAVKHSTEKSILFRFVNMFTTFCPRLSIY